MSQVKASMTGETNRQDANPMQFDSRVLGCMVDSASGVLRLLASAIDAPPAAVPRLGSDFIGDAGKLKDLLPIELGLPIAEKQRGGRLWVKAA